MAEALPYLKEVKISTSAGQGQTPQQSQQQGAGGAGMQFPGLPTGGGLSQPLMPLQWLQRGGFQPGKPSGGNMNFPGLPPMMQPLPFNPNMPMPGQRQQNPMIFPPFMR